MPIRARGSRYQVDVVVNKRRERTTAPTYEEAVMLEAEIRAAMLKGLDWKAARVGQSRRAGVVTMQDVFAITCEHYWNDAKSSDVLVYNGSAVVSIIGKDKPVNEVDTRDVDRVVAHLSARGNSNATINRKLAALSKMLSVAQDRRLVAHKLKIDRKREGTGRIRWVDVDEEQRLLAFFEHMGLEEERDFFTFAIDTGCRTGELRRLQVRDVVDGNVTLWETKSGVSRTVPLTARCRAIAARLTEGKRKTDLLFPNMTRRYINATWDKARQHLGLEEDSQFVPHALRHTCATRLARAGVHFRAIKQWMGHASIQTTLRYMQFAPKDLDAAVNALESFDG